MTIRRRVLAVVVVAVACVSLGSCSAKGREQFRDAPRGAENNGAADTITFPDGFNNAATKCDHGNRLYVVFHGDSNYGSIAVVPKDPTCPQR